MIAAPLDDDHRAVVEIAHALTWFFTRLDHADLDILSRQEDRLKGVGQVVQIDDPNTVQPRDFVEVVVVGNNLPIQMLYQEHQLQIDRLAGKFGKLTIKNLDVGFLVAAHSIENVQASAAPRSFEPVGAV